MGRFDRVLDRRTVEGVKWGTVRAASQKAGRDVIPLWVADMDFTSPDAVVAALEGRAAHGVYGYAGKPESLFEAFRSWMLSRHGAPLPREWLMFSPGVVPAIATAIRAYTAPGDGVMIMPPVYHPFATTIRANGRVVREAALTRQEHGYELDFDAIESAARVSRLMLLCSPHNPVGRVWSAEEMETLAAIARKHNLVVFADEIHADLVYSPTRHPVSWAVSDDLRQRLVAAWAPSKTFNIAGLQASFVAIPDPALRSAFNEAQDAAGIGGMNCFAACAAEAAYLRGAPWLDELLPYLWDNYRHLRARLDEEAPGIKVLPCQGTYLAWLDCSGIGLSGDVYEPFLARAGLWIEPGSRYGKGGEGYARLNFGCPRSVLDEAIDRMAQAFGITH